MSSSHERGNERSGGRPKQTERPGRIKEEMQDTAHDGRKDGEREDLVLDQPNDGEGD